VSERGIAFPLVISAPSGAGKTTLARTLVERYDDVVFSVSATTRSAREHERDGIDYHFVAAEEFDRLIEAGQLAEWAVVHGERYGTLRAEVSAARTRPGASTACWTSSGCRLLWCSHRLRREVERKPPRQSSQGNLEVPYGCQPVGWRRPDWLRKEHLRLRLHKRLKRNRNKRHRNDDQRV
jgi:hypothetical protein